ncbi:MAG: hypothetical protein IJZ13_02165, partial [Clostridia bacterium]|nr:hypothetical protein [Clostridia bacterium]
MNNKRNRLIALLSAVMLLVSAFAGVNWVAVTAEDAADADTYMANNYPGARWSLISATDVNALHGNNVCREGGKWDADNSFYTNLSRGTVIKVENVDFGDGKESVELSINAPASAADEPVYVYVGDESFSAAGNMKPNAMYLTDGAAAFAWHKAVFADFTGITGKQTVYIVAGANNQEAARFSLNGLRFAAADTTATVKGVYVANGEVTTNATLKHTVNEQLVGDVSNGKYIEFANVDLTDVAGITVRAGFKDGNKEYVVSIDGTDVGSVTAGRATKIEHGQYSFMRFTELALSGYTGTHTVRVTSKNGGMNLLGIELTPAAEEESSEAESSETTESSEEESTAPESSEPESSETESSAPESSEPESSEEESTVTGAAPETPTAPHWSVVTKAEIDGIHGSGTCRNEGGMSDGVVTGLGRGTVIKVENVDFGDGKASIQLSLKAPATAADEPVYVYVGDERFNAKGQAQPNAWFRTTESAEFTWHDALKADFAGITGLQTVYIVAGGHSEEVNKFELNGMKLLDEAPKATMRPYYVSYNGPITAMAELRTKLNECLVATITSGADKNTVYVKDVDFTDAIALTGYIAFEGAGTKAFDVYLDEDTTPIGRISITSEATKGGNYRFRPASMALVGKDITGVHDVKLVSINSNINLMGIELALATETGDDDTPDDTYTVNATDWVVIPKDTVNAQFENVCRDEPAWNLDGYISGMGRGSVVKVMNVDFGDGKETLELNVKVPSNANNRQVYVYIGDDSYNAE